MHTTTANDIASQNAKGPATPSGKSTRSVCSDFAGLCGIGVNPFFAISSDTAIPALFSNLIFEMLLTRAASCC